MAGKMHPDGTSYLNKATIIARITKGARDAQVALRGVLRMNENAKSLSATW